MGSKLVVSCWPPLLLAHVMLCMAAFSLRRAELHSLKRLKDIARSLDMPGLTFCHHQQNMQEQWCLWQELKKRHNLQTKSCKHSDFNRSLGSPVECKLTMLMKIAWFLTKLWLLEVGKRVGKMKWNLKRVDSLMYNSHVEMYELRSHIRLFRCFENNNNFWLIRLENAESIHRLSFTIEGREEGDTEIIFHLLSEINDRIFKNEKNYQAKFCCNVNTWDIKHFKCVLKLATWIP